MKRLDYTTPELTAHGKVEAITEGQVNQNVTLDRTFPSRVLITDLRFS